MTTSTNYGSPPGPSPATAPPDVSVIILSWNTREFLLGCLRSIEETAQGLKCEVLVVDNNSSDGSAEAARRGGFSNLRVIETGSNLGFAKGNNVGIRAATGRYYAIVNSDIVMKPGCLQGLLKFMDANDDVGLCGPRLLNPDGSVQANCRIEPTLTTHLGRALFINTSLADPACRKNTTADVEVLAGAFWLARRGSVDEVGLLDEDFFFYGEDLDWCHRFRKHGWRVSYFPTAESIHFGGVSSGLDAGRFSIELLRARLQLWEKYHGCLSTVLYLGIALVYDGLRYLATLLNPGWESDRRTATRQKRHRHAKALAWQFGRLCERLLGQYRRSQSAARPIPAN